MGRPSPFSDEEIRLLGGGLEIANVSHVKEVEAAVGERNGAAKTPRVGNLLNQFRPGHDHRPDY